MRLYPLRQLSQTKRLPVFVFTIAACSTYFLLSLLPVKAIAGAGQADLLIRNGLIYDGSGGTPYRGEVAITGERISYVGKPIEQKNRQQDLSQKTFHTFSKKSLLLFAEILMF